MTSLGDLSTGAAFALVMNQDVWRRLSEEDRAAIDSISGEDFARRLVAVDNRYDDMVATLKENGVRFEEMSPELAAELRDAFAFLESDWKETVEGRGIDGEAALKFYREQLAKEMSGG